MFRKLFVLLFPLVASGQIVGINNGQRRFRQLDLGTNDFTNEENVDNEFIDPRLVNNGYLPPVSSSSQPPIRIPNEATQQSQNVFINEEAKINNFLIPPFQELRRKPEQQLVNNVKPLPASQHVTEPKPPQNEILIMSTAQPTLDSRSYLPPQGEYSPAAQTPQGKVVALPQKEDDHHHHHHHHHHHDENFDICSDAFHSFLCAPLKARKRITGAFPESLRGQASFSQYQKAIPDRTPSSSNEFLNQYLPPNNQYLPPVNIQPARYTAPSNRIESTTFVQRTTQTPRTFPTSTFVPRTTQTVRTVPTTTYRYTASETADTSNDRFYLPPFPEQKKTNFFPRNPEPSNTVENVINRQSPYPSPSTLTESEVTPFNTFRSSDINKINSVFPTTQKPFVTTPVATTFNTFKTTQNFNSGSSFQPTFSSSTSQKPFTQTNFSRPSSPVSYDLTPKISSPSTTTFTRTLSTLKFQPSNSLETIFPTSLPSQSTQTVLSPVNNRFNPSKPPIQPSNFISTTLKSFSQSPNNRGFEGPVPQSSLDNNYLPPEPAFRAASNIIPTTVKSFTSPRKDVTTIKTPQNRPHLDNIVLPPLPDSQPEVTSHPIDHPDRKNLCIDPFNSFLCANTNLDRLHSTSRPVLKENEIEIKPAPTSKSDVVSPQPSNVSPVLSVDNGYKYLKPEIISPQPSSTSSVSSLSPLDDGYKYPKPEKAFPLPSDQKVTISSTTPKLITTPTPQPTTLQTTVAKAFTGYSYPEPEPAFPLPSEVIETADTGYVYPKPEKPFPQPAEQNVVTEAVVVPSPTTLAPSTTTRPPSPSTPAPSPTTPRPSSTTLAPSTARPEPSDKGYFYPKPQQSFNLPQAKGYSYPKPDNPLELPTEKEFYRPLFSETSTSSSSSSSSSSSPSPSTLDDLGSALFIPVNKLNKRSESTRTRRYGERLRKLERKPLF